MKKSLTQDDSDQVAVDLSPMIDCIFILLIFFIVTTVFVEETGVKVNKPDIGSSSGLNSNSILIAVTNEDKIIYGGKSYSLQGIGAQVKQLLAADSDTPVIIQGDAKATHGMVQRVHGQCKTAGALSISVSSKS